MSRAKVAGLQLIYIIFFGSVSRIVSTKALSQPLLGGSNTTTSGITPDFISFKAAFSDKSHINSKLSALFSFLFIFASLTAGAQLSMPYTFFAFLLRQWEIVPIPQ